MSASTDDYAISKATPDAKIAAPQLDYKPRDPKTYRPKIGLISCGGITAHHLTAYKNAGYEVVALCDKHEERAHARQAEFYPDAQTYSDYREVLRRDDIEVVDVATHPADRVPIIEDALRAHKHVLSQKPFVLDLDIGERLADLADSQNVKLAINQNGRWSPHFSYIREAIKADLLGHLTSAHLRVHWDHSWVKGTPFDEIPALVLYDFAIHWFDIVAHFFGDRTPRRVYASSTLAHGQRAKPPLLAQTLIEFDDAQASLAFDANVQFGAQDSTYVAGANGTIISSGPSLGEQNITLYTSQGIASPTLEGSWFPDGFHGAMAELLCAIEENRAPINNARDNLKGLGLCFAAVQSADDGEPKIPGQVRTLPAGNAVSS
jgi:predicted dehydrogenase